MGNTKIFRKPQADWRTYLIAVVTYVLLFVIFLSYYFPDFTFVLTAGKPAPYNIISPIDDQIEDKDRTQAAQDEAASRVPVVYNKNNLVLADSFQKIDILFNLAIAVVRDRTLLTPDERADQFRLYIVSQQDQVGTVPSEQTIKGMIDLNTAQIEDVRMGVEWVVKKLLDEGINEYSVSEIPRKVVSVVNQLGYPPETRSLINQLAPLFIKQNLEIDTEATNANRQVARDSVAPIIREIKKGEIIVKAGEVITTSDIDVFKRVGIARPVRDWRVWLGISLLPLALIVAIALIIYTSKKLHFNEFGQLIFLALLVIFYLATSRILVGVSLFFGLIIVFAFLLGMFFDNTIAVRVIFVVAPFTALFKTIGNTPLSSVAIIAIGFSLIGYLTIFTMPNVKRFLDFLIVGAYAFSGMVFSCVLFVLFAEMPVTIMINNLIVALISGLTQFFLAFGLTPLLEYFTSTTTVFRLLELSDLNHPALKQLIMEAPGTYQHSIFVGNMASVACEQIGANSLVARVGGYYHDLGKIKKPELFIENQPADFENPHDRMTPSASAQFIISHVHDGLEFADKYRIPRIIKDFMISHHGTSTVGYFLRKARNVDPLVDESVYRYDGMIPRTKEQAIVMIADAVESAGRAIQPEASKIDELVERLVNERIQDGQFNSAPISMAELTTVKRVFVRQLAAIRHRRIQYDTGKTSGNGQG